MQSLQRLPRARMQGSRNLSGVARHTVPPMLPARVQVRVAAPERVDIRPRQCPLYLYQWRSNSKAQTPEATKEICDELKRLEKVSKEALWFTVKESEDGGQHVLVVTADKKTARKYCLTELTDDVAAVTVPGLTDPVSVPVASLRAHLQAMMDEDSESDSSDEDMPPMMAPTTKEKKMDKKKDKKARDMQAAMTAMEEVQEGPAAAAVVAQLVAGVTGGGHQGGEVNGPIAEAVLGGLAQYERKKLKDAVKEVVSPQGAMGQPMMDESSSSSCSSESSESDCDEPTGSMMGDKKAKDRKMAPEMAPAQPTA